MWITFLKTAKSYVQNHPEKPELLTIQRYKCQKVIHISTTKLLTTSPSTASKRIYNTKQNCRMTDNAQYIPIFRGIVEKNQLNPPGSFHRSHVKPGNDTNLSDRIKYHKNT